jgi:hypothetical protein
VHIEVSGERTLAACWRWHSAIANFCFQLLENEWADISARLKKSSSSQNATTSTL